MVFHSLLIAIAAMPNFDARIAVCEANIDWRLHLDYLPIFLTFLISFLSAVLIIATSKWHGKYSQDHLEGVQRFHEKATPRIGGLAIIVALGFGVLFSSDESRQLLRLLFILGFFVFSFGFTEDITKEVSVALRLWAGFMPAVIAYFMAGNSIRSIGSLPIDYLLNFHPAHTLYTVFAGGGVTQTMKMLGGSKGRRL